MRDKVTFELSYYFSGENDEWLPYGDTDYDFYLQYIEEYFMKMLSYRDQCVFKVSDLRQWVKENTTNNLVYVKRLF